MTSINKVAFITGAGSVRGIGRATGHHLAKDGWNISIADIDFDAAKNAADEIATKWGVNTIAVRCDVTDPLSVDLAVNEVEAQLGVINGLINNAGITSPTRFLNITGEEWDKIFDVDVKSIYIVTHRILPGMISQGFGRIVNLSSVSAQRGGGVFGGSHYSAAKAALLGFARALAREVGHSGITVNCVAPGLIDTDITKGGLSIEDKRAQTADNPVPRPGTPDDVAASIAFLCSDGASYITGSTIDINGGSHIH